MNSVLGIQMVHGRGVCLPVGEGYGGDLPVVRLLHAAQHVAAVHLQDTHIFT
jgi:hypothetical protein